MTFKLFSVFILSVLCSLSLRAQQQVIRITDNNKGLRFEGIGALSAGASSKLLEDYPEKYRDQILDLLFRPKFGASLQQLKVEIGGDVNSTDATEPSHAHTREEFLNPKPEYFNRGYEWMLMKEAKKRNPGIFLDCLIWGCPGWIGDGRYYSHDNADYVAAFLNGAKKYHSLDIEYTGIWNEHKPDVEWIKVLRRTLDAKELRQVKIIAPDYFDWDLAEKMKNDKELQDAVYAIGIHYNERWEKEPYSSTAEAKSTGKSLRNSEGGPWRGDWDGFEYLIKLYNRNYIIGKATNVITWSLVSSYYSSLSIPNSGLMMANTPWSGAFEIQPAVWAAAHTSQFTEPGWTYIDSGCGLLKKGSFVSLKSPDQKELSIIIETADTTGTQNVKIILDKKFSNRTLHIWRTTRSECEFLQEEDIHPKNGMFSIALKGRSAYSITTTTGQQKGSYTSPAASLFPLPYSTGFEDSATGSLGKYFMDQAGVFEVTEREDRQGKCLRQVINRQGIEWQVGPNPSVETVIGDTAWSNMEISADVNIPVNTGSAKLIGRVTELHRGNDFPEGYWFRITTGSNWTLNAGNYVIASGNMSFEPFTWHKLKLRMHGNSISVFVDNIELTSITDNRFTHGLAGLGSDFNFAEFDNLEIRKTE